MREVVHLQEVIKRIRARASELHTRTSDFPSEAQTVIHAALEELYTALEEMQVSGEELRVQNEELLAAQVLVAEEQHRYQDLFQSAPDPYLVTDSIGTILEANRAAAALLGIRAGRMIRKPLVVFIPEEDRRAFRAAMTRLAAERRADEWELRMQPRGLAEPVDVSCTVTTVVTTRGTVDALRWTLRDVTERRAAEANALALTSEQAARKEAETRRAFLDAVVRQMPGGVVIGEAPDGRIALHNAEAERVLRHTLPLGEVMGTSPVHGMMHPGGELYAPADYPLARVLASGEPIEDREALYRLGDGTLATLRLNASVVRDANGNNVAAVVAFTDVTAERREERDQRFLSQVGDVLSSSLDYKATLQNVARLVAGAKADYCLVHVEEESGIHGHGIAHADPTREEILRGLLRRFPLRAEGPHPVVQTLRTGEPQLIPVLGRAQLKTLATGPEHLEMLTDLRLASAMVVPMQARGRTLGAITFARTGDCVPYDERDLALATELARRSAMAVDNARLYEEARNASRMRDDVLAVVSHDLRNPLNGVLLGATLLDEFSAPDRWNERERKQLGVIRRSAEQMNRLIQDLVEIVGIEKGAPSLDTRRQDPRSLLSGARDLFEQMAWDQGIRLECEADDGIPSVVADQARVLQVLSNLVGNALKHTEPGGAVRLEAQALEGEVRFAVSDTGSGIPAEHLPRLFDRYWQASRTDRTGLGLGLAIAKGLVEAHRGQIWVESTRGEGTTFYFTLPADASPAMEPVADG